MFRSTSLIIIAILVSGCSGGNSSTSPSPTPTPTPPPSISNPGVLVSQSGCAATFACPNTDIAGMSNPTTPTFDTLTMSNGTTEGCRVGYTRSTSGGNGTTDSIVIGFTVRNPSPTCGFSWASESHSDNTGFVTTAPFGGCTLNPNPGPFQATAQFVGSSTAIGSQQPNFTEVLTLIIHDVGQKVWASCGIPVYGVLKS
jgi:hypothetical protein